MPNFNFVVQTIRTKNCQITKICEEGGYQVLKVFFLIPEISINF